MAPGEAVRSLASVLPRVPLRVGDTRRDPYLTAFLAQRRGGEDQCRDRNDEREERHHEQNAQFEVECSRMRGARCSREQPRRHETEQAESQHSCPARELPGCHAYHREHWCHGWMLSG